MSMTTVRSMQHALYLCVPFTIILAIILAHWVQSIQHTMLLVHCTQTLLTIMSQRGFDREALPSHFDATLMVAKTVLVLCL